MPGLYSLAAHSALQEVQAGLRDGEAVFAFLDDVYVVALPDRVRELYAAVEVALWRHAHVQLNRAKTRIWNAAGEEPANIGDLRPVGGDPDWALPRDQQGLKVLGTPLGSEAFVRNPLVLKREAHDRLLHAIPAVEDLQAAWLLLRCTASQLPLPRLVPSSNGRLRRRARRRACCVHRWASRPCGPPAAGGRPADSTACCTLWRPRLAFCAVSPPRSTLGILVRRTSCPAG